MNTKKCFFAAQMQIKKNATRDGKQRYKCTACNKRFSGGRKLDPDTPWQPYSVGKQTDTQLAGQYGCSIKTIRRHLAKAATQATCATPQVAAAANLIVDITYFGRKWGVMVLYDARSKRALAVTTIERETNALYMQAVATLREKGVVIQSIICDGKSDLLGASPDIPVQMCQFHQIKIIVRHLTRKPVKPGSTGFTGLVANPNGYLGRRLRRHSSAGTSSTPPS